jgi:PHP family Zn ribbon phosphoesterase
VLYRIEQLGTRDPATVADQKIPFKSIVPLEVIIADAFELTGRSGKKVQSEYMKLTDQVANEFTLLLDTPIEEIAKVASDPLIPEAIRRMRASQLALTPGYDGIFGTVKIFGNDRPSKKQSKLL